MNQPEASPSNTADAGRGLSEGLGPLPPHHFSNGRAKGGALYTADQMRAFRAAGVAAKQELLRAALLHEASQWTGDFRMPVHKALCDAAKRAGVPLTLDECYQAAKRA